MSVEDNRAAARRFIEEGLDGENQDVLDELFLPGAVRHFPPGDIVMPLDTSSDRPRRTQSTEIHQIIGEGEFVSIHLTHHVRFDPGSTFRTRAGVIDVGGESVQWNAMVLLRFDDGRIAEEWVVRDELQILVQVGVVVPL